MSKSHSDRIEWPTLALFALFWVGWGSITILSPAIGTGATIAAIALLLALYSSLQHEALHGHPTGDPRINACFASLPAGMFIPYRRFRDLHLAHHNNPALTDPYDDPESFYVHSKDWSRRPAWLRLLLQWNNTLVGRMVLGPALGLAGFWLSDLRAIMRGDVTVLKAWLFHCLLLVPVMVWLGLFYAPGLVAYATAAYGGLSIVYIRTFLEHQARPSVGERTVIVEDRGPLSFLFLNNNLHAAHHLKPTLAWYRLPGFYRTNRERILAANRAYLYPSYAAVFRHYAFRQKEPVVHPYAADRPER